MSRLVYNYEIIDVDYTSKSMEIVYKHATYGTMNISTRLPYTDETLDQLVEMYAPVDYWLEQNKKPLQVSVGTTGMSSKPIQTANEVPSWLENRLLAYGTLEGQIEFITEKGLQAWQSNVAAIKEKYPKPTED